MRNEHHGKLQRFTAMADVFRKLYGGAMKAQFLPEELTSLTDEEIRVKTKAEIGNGGYAIHICRGCGRVWTSPTGEVSEAKITDRCRYCIEEPK